jgi:cellulose synthase/poly-beta-1,6-N-acetylglucosamine synthase-like glycosyltransferase
MNRLGSAMWGSLALIVWTHAGYPAAAAVAASRSRYRPRSDDAHLPTIALVIAAHDEERVIGERLDNALALGYPAELLEIVVSLDGSTDGTREIVEGYGVTLIDNPRGGKVPAQNAAVRATSSDVVAFSDANSMWEPDALRRLVRHFADPEVGYVCGRLRLIEPGTGRNVEGQYWRYELWLRALESRLGSITAGNGAIYAVRRSAYVELEPGQSHDIGLPFRLRRAGLRSLYEPEAVASELSAPTTSAEWERKVRMLSRSWNDVLRGGMLDPRDQPPQYFAELISHRLLRYATGPLHVVLLLAALAQATTTRSARAVVAGHALWLGLALSARRSPGRSRLADFAWYYLVVTAASLAGLARMATQGPQATWSAAEGTR